MEKVKKKNLYIWHGKKCLKIHILLFLNVLELLPESQQIYLAPGEKNWLIHISIAGVLVVLTASVGESLIRVGNWFQVYRSQNPFCDTATNNFLPQLLIV